MVNKELTQEDLDRMAKHGYLTIGKLKKFIKDLPDDGLVLTQRVEDKYYEGVDISGMGGCQDSPDGIFPPGSKAQGWGVVLKEGHFYHQALDFNERIRSGEFENKEEYPDLDPEFLKVYSEEDLRAMKEQYSPAFCCVKYNDDKNLYIDLHY